MDCYLYSHSNAGGIFYIGKGTGYRANQKHWNARSSEWHEASKDGYTSKIEAHGTESEILSLEKITIKSLVAIGVNLVNKIHNPNWVQSDEVLKIRSDAQLGRKHPDEVKQKISDYNTGKTHSDETKQKISDKAKQRTGDKNSFFGKTHSDESKQKMSASSNNAGKNNPMFGKKNIATAIRWQHYRLAKANAYIR
tara:strand:- start:787 stop:1371 length:585 start_codon:yes stop_codon:yes gene_type:complete